MAPAAWLCAAGDEHYRKLYKEEKEKLQKRKEEAAKKKGGSGDPQAFEHMINSVVARLIMLHTWPLVVPQKCLRSSSSNSSLLL